MPRPPVIVLVRPQLAQNIGTVARAMLNCGLEELRLVAPRDGWPNRDAWPAASGADRVLDGAGLFTDLAAAVADLGPIWATTARLRDMNKPVATPRETAEEMHRLDEGVRPGILFGPERTGLDNDEVAMAERILYAPLNPEYASLNLAQAVLLVAYEWRIAGGAKPPEPGPPNDPLDIPATRADLENFYEHLEGELAEAGFFEVPEKRPILRRKLRNIWSRARLSRREVRMLHGMVRRLVGRPKDGRAAPR